MSKKSLQIRVSTGQGFFKDEDFGAYEGLEDAQFKELAEHYQLAALGSMFDFIDSDKVKALLERGTELTDEDMQGFQTLFNGQPVAPGTVYGVMVGEEMTFAQEFITQKVKEKMSSDRVVAAKQDSMSAAAGGEAQQADMSRGQRTGTAAKSFADKFKKMAPPSGSGQEP